MTSRSEVHTGGNRYGWRRVVAGAVAGSALAVGLLVGAAAPTAFAVPTTGADEPPAPKMSTDEALAIIAADYDTGAGGGQISQLIHEVLVLRAQGFKPSNANGRALSEALDKRPNQTPLVDALKSTVSFQRKLQAQAAGAVTPGGFTAGINQLPPGMAPDPTNPDNTGVFIGPTGGGVQQPIG
ncbi:hypothetical protein [Mycolicibacterium wolinskyi]|uniref:Uncharacterized protein n=1 Tax=Mycolicibacterium wolinskyi TaxID=59750 RepID=A0A132PHT3_9MYCO|nr:hypothetical protein [Mycolicibacterium wolinskyi]KWX21895.1 hypothetical protein AFM11_22230 [Mycolicibacterium wolinskyi]